MSKYIEIRNIFDDNLFKYLKYYKISDMMLFDIDK